MVAYAYQQTVPHGDDEEDRYDEGARITWDDLIAAYMKYLRYRKRGKKHIYDTNNSLTHDAEWFKARGIPPAGANRRNATEYLQALVDLGRADITVHHKRTKLRAIYAWAYVERLFKTHKLLALEAPEDRPKSRYTLVTEDEIDRIVRQIELDWSPEYAPGSRFKSIKAREFFPARDIASTLGLAETGARVSEWFRLDLGDWDPEERTLTFRDTKNGDPQRVVPVTEAYAAGPLARWLAVRSAIKCGTDRLFLSETCVAVDPYGWGKRWDKYRQHAGIERRIRSHDLRHFSSTAHDRVDKDLSKLIIGHHTDAAHEGYSHRELAELRDAHDKAHPVREALQRLAERQAQAVPMNVARRRAYTKPK